MCQGTAARGMKTDRITWIKRACWFLFFAICVFHIWSDGRNGMRMMELERQGQPHTSALVQIHWLCGPLNFVTLIVLAVVVGLSITAQRLRKRVTTDDHAA
jgi:hypothetical protein